MAQDAAMNVEQIQSVTTTQNALYESFTYEAIEEARDDGTPVGYVDFDGKEYVSQAVHATMVSRAIFGLLMAIKFSYLQNGEQIKSVEM